MYLRSLTMQGFKSFPDKTTLNFGKGITAVVGPNGSGKSNISDAVRWVLGEQSTKSLRGAKMEDVVFAGTSERRAVGYAEVTLKLDNKDGSLKIDNSEVSITRRYYRSGESEYKLNGEIVRLRDIHELFMDTGLGKSGYSIVSQGKINDMISAKSTERRDMFEEAAGISHYRYRRTDSLRRLDQAEDNLIRLRDILAELENRVEPLRIQSEKAQQFLTYASERKNLEIGLWLRTIERTKENLVGQETKLTAADAQYKAAEKELFDIEAKIESTHTEIQEITVRIDEKRRTSFEIDEKALSLSGEIAVLKNSIEHNNEAIDRILRDKLLEDDVNKRLAEQIDEAKKEITDLETIINGKKTELLAVTDEINALSGKSELAAGKYETLSSDLSRLSIELADCRVLISQGNSSALEIDSRIKAIEENEAEQTPLIDALTKQSDEAKNSLLHTKEKLTEHNNALDGLVMLKEQREKKAKEIAEQENKLKNELMQTNSKSSMLLDLERNMEGYYGSVKAVMKEVKRGTLTGIHAPVSQLLTVKEEYALAIETALGAQLQNIVTNTEDDAKRAITFLKNSGSGRATFLPLTAIKGKNLEEKSLEDCFGFIDIASNLVSHDKKYKEIILSQLGRTVVADDMDSAVVIAKKYGYRFKVVTLDGQVVNAGGSITGGSKTHSAGILSRGNEIEKLNKKAQEIKSALNIVSANVKNATEKFNKAEASLTAHKSEITALNEDFIRFESLWELKRCQLETALSSKRAQEDEKNSIVIRKEKILKEKEDEEKRLLILQKEISKIESNLSEITGDRDSFNDARERLISKLQDINLQILSNEKEIEAKNETIDRLKRRGSSHKDRISQLDFEIKEIENKNSDIKEQIEQTKTEQERLDKDKNEIEEVIAEFIKQREQSELQSSKMRLLERSKSTEREALSREVVRLEERKSAMMREYDDVCAKLFEEYELTRREAEQLGIVIENVGQSQKRLSELKSKIKALGSVNVAAIDEYREVSERYLFLGGQIEDVETSKKELIKMINELTDKMAKRFSESFILINESFSKTFGELFEGGKAELKLTDELDILESGIDINVQPPGKNIQNIDLLSGGEKGLSAIALLFAMLKVSPSPFCIFDEVEAALDDVNVNKYASYLRTMSSDIQFILITHRRGTMEESDMLYGVTMQEKGVSKLLELKTAQMVKQLGLE